MQSEMQSGLIRRSKGNGTTAWALMKEAIKWTRYHSVGGSATHAPSSLVTDAPDAALGAAVVDETVVVDETAVVDETVMGADAAAAADAKLEALATGLTSFPTELSSAQQAMAARGGLNDPLPFLPRHGATAAEAVTLLRGVWTRVLELSIAEVESLDDDATPFGSLGTLNGLGSPPSASNCL